MHVPLLVRPWVMDCTHKEVVDLGSQLAKVVEMAEDGRSKEFPHMIKMFDWSNQYNVHLREDKFTTICEASGTWYWQLHVTTKNAKKYMHCLERCGRWHWEGY